MSEAELLAASSDGIAAVRVRGRGTFKVSKQLCRFGEEALAGGASGLIVDLGECTGMDSTFMGVLAMLGLKGRDGVAFVIVNATPALRELLETIGVARLWKFSPEAAPGGQWNSICRAAAGAISIEGAASTVLKAHQTLMQIDPENIPRFEALVRMLESELNDSDQ